MDVPYAIIIQLIEFTPLLPGLWTMVCSERIRSEMFAFGKTARRGER